MFGFIDVSDHGTLEGLSDDDHPQYLLIDGTRAMEGAITTQDVLADVTGRAFGTDAIPFGKAYTTQLQNVVGAGSKVWQAASKGGLMAGYQTGGGSVTHRLDGGLYPAVLAVGNCDAAVGATAVLEASSGGASAMGSASASGSGYALVSSSGYASFAAGYAYGAGTSELSSSGAGSVAVGYANGFGSNATAQIQSTNRGSFAQGLASATAGSPSKGRIRASGGGSFCQGYALSLSTSLAGLLASGGGSFAQGLCRNTGTNVAGSTIAATGEGSFAQGYALSTGVGLARVLSAGKGAFAQGYAGPGAVIDALADNAVQFGPGINAQPDSLQVGAAGLRLKGTTGAPGALQNGDFWVSAGFVYLRSNGVTRKIDGIDI